MELSDINLSHINLVKHRSRSNTSLVEDDHESAVYKRCIFGYNLFNLILEMCITSAALL